MSAKYHRCIAALLVCLSVGAKKHEVSEADPRKHEIYSPLRQMSFHDLFYRAEVEQDPLGLRPATECFRPPSGADPGFPRGGRQPEMGHQPII